MFLRDIASLYRAMWTEGRHIKDNVRLYEYYKLNIEVSNSPRFVYKIRTPFWSITSKRYVLKEQGDVNFLSNLKYNEIDKTGIIIHPNTNTPINGIRFWGLLHNFEQDAILLKMIYDIS